jgi:steroid delta-isomerase-like uncharacterized protein
MSRPQSIGELVERYAAAWNAHDLDAIMALHAEDSAFRIHLAGYPVAQGNAAVREAFREILETIPDQQFELGRLIIGADHFIWNLTIRGTFARPFAGRPPNGKPFVSEIHDVITCENNLVKVKDNWVDLAGFMQGLD